LGHGVEGEPLQDDDVRTVGHGHVNKAAGGVVDEPAEAFPLGREFDDDVVALLL
jgi:hypothetical protein